MIHIFKPVFPFLFFLFTLGPCRGQEAAPEGGRTVKGMFFVEGLYGSNFDKGAFSTGALFNVAKNRRWLVSGGYLRGARTAEDGIRPWESSVQVGLSRLIPLGKGGAVRSFLSLGAGVGRGTFLLSRLEYEMVYVQNFNSYSGSYRPQYSTNGVRENAVTWPLDARLFLSMGKNAGFVLKGYYHPNRVRDFGGIQAGLAFGGWGR